MSDPRWPDDGPTWPERDLPGENDPNPWTDAPDAAGIDAEPPLSEPGPPEPIVPSDGWPEPPFRPAEPPEPVFSSSAWSESPFPEPEPPEPAFPEPTFLERPTSEPEPEPEPEPCATTVVMVGLQLYIVDCHGNMFPL